MRLAKIKYIPRIIIYLGLVALLIALLSVSGTVSNQNKSIGASTVKSASEQTQKPPEVATESKTDSEIGTSNSSSETDKSSNTKVRVAVRSNTSNNKTTGSTKVKITQNGETKIINDNFDEVTDGSSFRIKVNGGEVDFDFDFRQDTKDESSISQRIKIKNEVD